MELHELKPKGLVEHEQWGIGEIVCDEESRVVIDFPNNPEESHQVMSKSQALSQLRSLPEHGLESMFNEDQDTIRTWVYEGQLRLIGAALADAGGECKVGTLQSRLESRFLIPMNTTWKTWWDKARPIAMSSGHFAFDKSKPIRLLSRVEDIPIESAFPPPKATSRPSPKSRAKSLSSGAVLAELEQQRQAHLVDLRQQRQVHAAELQLQQEHHAAELKLQRENHAKDLKLQRETHDADLKLLQRQVDEKDKRIDGIRAQIAEKREESRLDIRRGMLEVIAETLKSLQAEKDTPPEALLRDVKAGLEIAIQAGGAKWYGKPGEIVEFDPRLHDGEHLLSKGQSVKVKTRGALRSGG